MANPTQGGGTSTTTVGEAKEQAAETARREVETAGQVVSTARNEAAAVTQSAAEEARHLYTEVRTTVSSEADGQLRRLSEGARSLSDELRSMASSADDPESPGARAVRQAAGVVDGLGGYLEGGTDDLLRQVKRAARQRPGMFLLGALGAGFVVGRLARNLASEPERTESIDLRDRPVAGYEAGSVEPASADVWAIEETTVAAVPPWPGGGSSPVDRPDVARGGAGPVGPPSGGGHRG